MKMRTGRREERHRHVALVAAAPTTGNEFQSSAATLEAVHSSGFSLLRLSLLARLLLVAIAAALLWFAVFWALV
jgi:hypothetical protein